VLKALVEGAEAIVPVVWRLEVVNMLVVAERRRKIPPAGSARFLRDLQQFNIRIDIAGVHEVFDSVLQLARVHQRSSYDASYLELAKRGALPLATKDEPLRQAAVQAGISIFAP
jgi:predicted nucleic acid-binding protein